MKSVLRRVLLERRNTNGERPGLRGVGPLGPDRGEQWVFPRVRLTEKDKKEILAAVIKSLTSTMFKSHM